MDKTNDKLTVIDFFSGAGGFSEGFRQQGFEIIEGIDYWKPAVITFNHNFSLDGIQTDILKFANEVEIINQLPNSDIILGSPPCVSFSSSNKQGTADKTLGINLIETFLRVVAVKKFQPNSILKAWFMENVPNSIKHTKNKYTFSDLSLSNWAKEHGLKPDDEAIDFINNHKVLNSYNFGVAQSRKRLFAGEIVKTGSFPELTENEGKTIRSVFKDFPKPFTTKNKVIDPNYSDIELNKEELTDHDYDTGIYQPHWDYSKYCKTNHPYMGRMSFPENLDKPSRTVTATKLDNSREAIIYDDVLGRDGNGQYRTPTIRELGVLMSFPITFQFLGSESTKWRLVGNAVTPLISSAIAKSVLRILSLPTVKKPIVNLMPNLAGVNNLNNLAPKSFDRVLVRKKGARFRRHPFKDGNLTVALSNYCLKENGRSDGFWRTTVTYGTGKTFKLEEFNSNKSNEIKQFILKNFENGELYINKVNSDILHNIPSSCKLQDIYENDTYGNLVGPISIINMVKTVVSEFANGEIVETNNIFSHKEKVYKKQLYSLFAIIEICNKIGVN